MADAYQSTEIGPLCDGLAIVLEFGTGLDSSKIIESWEDEPRAKYEGEDAVVFRFVKENAAFKAGAGRLGTPADLILQVRVYARNDSDQAGQQKYLGRAVYSRRKAVQSCLQAINIFAAYDPLTGEPVEGSLPITVVPLQEVDPTDVGIIPTDSTTWGLNELFFQVKCVLPITQP